jgi:predicted nucleotidyltransferase
LNLLNSLNIKALYGACMKAREGDLLETKDSLVFDVKGAVHPQDRIVAFPRFVPDPDGNRKRRGGNYRKIYALSERYKLLEERFPSYLVFDSVFGERLSEVPKKDVLYHYDPIDRLQELRNNRQIDQLEADALQFAKLLQDHSDAPWNKLGISGSLLAQLHTPESDIDLMVYGEKSCCKIYETLKSVKRDRKSAVKAYTQEELRILYNFRLRDTKMSFEDFVATERRKALQGKFLQHDFYIRCVKDWCEIKEHYGDAIYRRAGYARIKAVVLDDSEAIFTPCRYSIENTRVLEEKCEGFVTEIASFRGRFCEQARKGETVIAQGKVEEVKRKNGTTFFRLLLGGKPSDFMMLAR